MKIFNTKSAALAIYFLGTIVLFSGCAATHRSDQAEETLQPVPKIKITSISAYDDMDKTQLTIAADSPLTFSSLKQPDPLAVIVYLPQANVDKLPESMYVDSELISKVISRTGKKKGAAKIEIRLANDANYTATREGNDLILAFNRNIESAADAKTIYEPFQALQSPPLTISTYPSVELESGTEASGDITESSIISPESKPRVSPPVTGKTAWMNKIDFVGGTVGKSTLSIGTTAPIEFLIEKTNQRKIAVRLLNTRIPSYRQRPLITTRFNSAVDRVVPVQLSKDARESIITIEMRESVPYYTEQVDNLLMIHFEASSIPPKPMEQAQLPPWKQAMITAPASGVGDYQPASQQYPDQSVPTETGQIPAADMIDEEDLPLSELEQKMYDEDSDLKYLLRPKKRNYTGERIALDFFDTDIKNVFRILREVSGKNFAIDKDVTGKVTMTLDKPVPWDQVLDLVLRMNQLGMTDEGDIVRIATLETLKREDDLRKAKLAAIKAARDEAKTLEPLITRYFPISYSDAKSDVEPHIKQILTDNRGSVTVDEKNNQVIVTDTITKIKLAETIVRRIDKVTSQVLIEAKVVEVTKSFSKELGFIWGLTHGPGIIPGMNWSSYTDAAIDVSSEAGSSIGIEFARLSGVPFTLNARLNAIQTTGDGEILSAPKILTLDNKTAKIKQGLEYPYLERDSSGGSSVKFKNIDLLLEVTPHVTPDNRIALEIYITKNDVADVTDGIPSVSTNEATTELLINDGDTIVIGGIIKKTKTDSRTGFPWLADIPLLGVLFRSDTKKRGDNELLIFMTPQIVRLEEARVQ
ncbi:MAG: type IV pilus secretin PilQ [Desulfobacteraceae bacterium]|nr:type IV pilus secretin PilQ [Desulfobacteraceae bacterium]